MDNQGAINMGTPATGTPARDLFISYSSADEKAAREMRRHLEQAGYSCWMAPDDVRGMEPWAEQILAAIEGCRVIVVLLSASANASRHVSREVNLALGRGKAILPVRIEEVPPEGALEYLLSLVQRVDAFPPPFRSHLEAIQAHLAAVLAQPLPNTGDAGALRRRPVSRRRQRIDSRIAAALAGALLGLVILVGLAVWPMLNAGAGTGTATPSPPPTGAAPTGAAPTAAATPTGVLRSDIRSLDDLAAVMSTVLGPTDGPADYERYVRRADLTGQIETEFPEEWDDVSGTTFIDASGAPVGVLIAASSDLSRVYQAFDTAGLFIGASSDQAAVFDADQFLATVRSGFVQNCLLAGRHDVDLPQLDGSVLSGKMVVWRNCQRSGTVIVQAGLVRDDRVVAYVIDARTNTAADVGAVRHGLERLRLLTPFIITPGSAPDQPPGG